MAILPIRILAVTEQKNFNIISAAAGRAEAPL